MPLQKEKLSRAVRNSSKERRGSITQQGKSHTQELAASCHCIVPRDLEQTQGPLAFPLSDLGGSKGMEISRRLDTEVQTGH